MILTDRQVKQALLTLFKQEIRDLYDVADFALTSTGKVIAKLALKKP